MSYLRNLLASLLLPLLLMGVATSAHAQTVPNLEMPPPETPVNANDAPHVVLRPSVSFTNLGYDSNVFNLPSDQRTSTSKGDWVASLAAALAPVWRSGGGVVISGNTGIVANYYKQFSTERGIDGTAAGRIDVPIAFVRLHASGGYANLRQRVNFEIDQRARRTEDNAAAGADVALGARTTIGLEVRRSAVTFADDDVVSLTLRDTSNREEKTAVATFTYAITPITSFVATGDRGSHHFDLSPGRDGNSSGLAAGLQFGEGGLLNGNASLGWRRVTVANPFIPTFTGLVGNLAIGTTVGIGTRLAARARRDVVFSADPLAPYYAQISAGASITQAIGERWDIGVRGDRVWLNYVRAISETAPAYREYVDVWGASITFHLPAGWRIGVNAETMRRSASTDPLRDYTTNRIYTVISPTLRF